MSEFEDASENRVEVPSTPSEQPAPTTRAKALRDEILGSALSLHEAAYVLGLDRTTVAKYLRDNTLVGFQIGREWLVPEDELRDYVRRLIAQRRREAGLTDGASDAGPPRPGPVSAGLVDRVFRDLFGVRRGRERSDRFTPRARAVLKLAGDEAIRLNHQFIGTEHLLLALVAFSQENAGIAARVLAGLGVAPERVREAVEARIGSGSAPVDPQCLGLTARAKKAMELGADEANRLRHGHLGTEHVLLGLIREGEGIAAEVLGKLGVTLDAARAETLRALGESGPAPGESAPPIPAEAASLVRPEQTARICRGCGARCPAYFRHCFNCGRTLGESVIS